MSTERSTFGLDSILPPAYRNKAEAFAKCLQDKLRSLSGAEESTITRNGAGLEETPATPHGSFSKYSEEEIADSVFLQGALAYKRRSIPERIGPPPTNGKYISSIADRRGLSSDSEDSDDEYYVPAAENTAVNRRINQLQNEGNSHRKLISVNSVDSVTSWCSCEDPDEDEDEEVIDTLAAQIKGSPTIHNPRTRNFKRKGNKLIKEEPPERASAAESELFFDFDVECFSPVDLNDEEDEAKFDFQTSQLQLRVEECVVENENGHKNDTGQNFASDEDSQAATLTLPSSPIVESSISENCDGNRATCAQNYSDASNNKQCKKEDKLVIEGRPALVAKVNTLEEAPTEMFPNLNAALMDDIHCLALTKEEKVSLEKLEKYETEKSEKEPPTEDRSSERNNVVEISSLPIDSVESKGSEIEEPRSPFDCGYVIEQCCALYDDLTVEKRSNEDSPSENIAIHNETICKQIEDVTSGDRSNNEREGLQEIMENSAGVASIVITSCDDNDVEDIVSPRMKLRRCSSLKTWKTPPGTPGRKKIVRFADALGLDLADVRTFLDELPKIPKSAFEDLNYEPPPVAVPSPTVERTLIPLFQQPGAQVDFIQRVRQFNVSLESAVLTDVSLLAISGIVRVRNLSFHKSVHIRYSKDSWATFSDLQATFVPGSSDGFCDNFSFTLYGHTLCIGDRLEFAIRYECGAGQFWDSNGGVNYAFQCMPRSPLPQFPPLGSSPVDTWTKFY